MGSLIHPVAELARAAAANRDLPGARRLVAEALEADPADPDLICERAILCIYESREREAFELVPLAMLGSRFQTLAQMLCEHLCCRTLAEPKNSEPWQMLDLMRSVHEGAFDQVGITISACLIAKNEEENLARCLASLTGAVDQIVVVDTGSTDATVSIAQSYGATIGAFEWHQDFSAARNKALELATGHWILWIDADEELPSESILALKKAVIHPCFGGFDLEIVNFTDAEGYNGQFRHTATRLFRKLKGVQFTGRIHEQISPSLSQLGLPWARLPGAYLLHHGYRPQVMEKRSKTDRTVSMLEREVREDPSSSFQWFNLANAYMVAGRLAEAEHAAKRSVNLLLPGASYGSLAYHVLAQAASSSGKTSAALAACTEAEMHGFGSMPIVFEKCQALLRDNRPDDALEVADRLLQLEWPEGATGDRGICTHKRFVLRGQILAVLGRFDEALAMLDQAYAAAPTFAPTSYTRAAVLEKLGRLDEALEAFTVAAKDPQSYSLAMKGRARSQSSLGRYKEAADSFRLAWDKDPQDFDAWVGWTRSCEAGGDVAAVLGAYEAFAKLHEPSAEILINWGRALDTAGDPDRALHCFTEAIKREPNSANAYFNCGDLLYRNGAVSDAAHLYEVGLQYAPMNPEAWFTYGNALARAGLPSRAVQAYRNALDQNPRHEGAIHNLAVIEQPQALAA